MHKIPLNLIEYPLQDTSVSASIPWDDKELAGLIQYIALYHDPDGASVWPTHKNWDFWDSCSAAVAQYSGLPTRTSEFFFHLLRISQYFLCMFV